MEQTDSTGVGSSLSRRYVGAPGRQVHLTEAGTGKSGTPLWCLHATAYSGRSLSPFLLAMAAFRKVVAVDTPGYGSSDPPPEPWTIDDYSNALDLALDAAGETAVDLLGYHTGSIIAADLARKRPERIRRLILIGVPYFDGVNQQRWRARLAKPSKLEDDLSQFQARWDYLITQRDPGVNLTRGFDNFVDELRAYPQEWWAHEAALTFDVISCFSSIEQACLVLNPQNHLAESSRQAAAAMPNAVVVEMPTLRDAIFDNAPETLAAHAAAFLSG